jgi:hypothetical protein
VRCWAGEYGIVALNVMTTKNSVGSRVDVATVSCPSFTVSSPLILLNIL